jgi:hypothetical protein
MIFLGAVDGLSSSTAKKGLLQAASRAWEEAFNHNKAASKDSLYSSSGTLR